MTNLNITLNNEKYKPKLEENRSKRLERYIFSYVVEREGWQMAENIAENFLEAKNVNFHDPKFPFIDLVVKRDNSICSKDELLNIKSSRQATLRSAIYSSLRGTNPSQKFLVSQINYILRSTNTTRAGDQMLGSKIVKALKGSKNFKKDLKRNILREYNRTHDTNLTKFNDIPTLSEKVSMCFIYNPIFIDFRQTEKAESHQIFCQLNMDQTVSKTFKILFDRTLAKCYDKNYNIADLVFYVFQEKNSRFSNKFILSTVVDDSDVKKIRKIYGLNGTMSNLKNDLINQIRDMGNIKNLKKLKKDISSQYLQ